MTRPQSPVVRRKGIMGGRPCIRGTNILVDAIVGLFHSGYRFEDLHRLHPTVSRQRLEDVIRWHMNGRRWGKKAGRRG